ncbi:hypothetical protein [Dyella sp.]|uniref:hypothetical protein n=1 Tax=Dyella sp. TaxID=1869338 RepID=UPI003F7DE75F
MKYIASALVLIAAAAIGFTLFVWPHGGHEAHADSPAAASSDVTGSYMWSTADTIEYLELRQSADGHLLGQWKMSSSHWEDLPGFGEISAAANGWVSQGVLSLSLSSTRWPQPMPIMGKLEGDAISIVMDGAAPMRFSRVSPAAYRAAVEQLKTAAPTASQ